MGKAKKLSKQLKLTELDRANIDEEFDKAVAYGDLVEIAENVLPETVTWKRNITLPHLVALIAGTILGVSMFTFQSNVYRVTGSAYASLKLYLLASVYAILGSICFTEIASTIPYNCADYLFHMEFNGDAISFARIFSMSMLSSPCMIARNLITGGQYITHPLYESCQDMLGHWQNRSIAAITLRKRSYIPETADAQAEYRGYVEVMQVFSLCVYTFDRWNLKKSMAIAITLVMVSIFCITMCYFVLLSGSVIKKSGYLLPFELIETILEDYLTHDKIVFIQNIFSILIGITAIGSAHGALFVNIRYAHFPRIFGFLNMRTFTPTIAVIVTTFMTLIMICLNEQTIDTIWNSLICMDFIMFGNIALSQIIYRLLYPNIKREYQSNLAFPILFCFFSFALLIVIVTTTPKVIVMLFISLVCTIPFYMFNISKNKKKGRVIEIYEKITKVLQKIFLSLPDEKVRKDILSFDEHVKVTRDTKPDPDEAARARTDSAAPSGQDEPLQTDLKENDPEEWEVNNEKNNTWQAGNDEWEDAI